MIGRTVLIGLVLGWILAPSYGQALEVSDRFSLRVDAGPAYYRYTETGKKEFSGFQTEWADIAFLGGLEARYRTPARVVPLLRFAGLTSAEDTETNNQGSPSTEMHIAYFFNVQPGAQMEFRPRPWLTLAPELSWDLDWYKQVRQTSSSGTVNEAVFWHGPALGAEAAWFLGERWSLSLGYRHSFLIDVVAANTFTNGLGFNDFSTSGQRDVIDLRWAGRVATRWTVSVGYRFELARVDASSTQTRMSTSSLSPGLVQAQFPENEHIVNAVNFGVSF